jgi:hypothetical protein
VTGTALRNYRVPWSFPVLTSVSSGHIPTCWITRTETRFYIIFLDVPSVWLNSITLNFP